VCSNYEPVTDTDRLLASFGVRLAAGVEPAPHASAGMLAPFITASAVKSPNALGDVQLGILGLLPRFATDIGFSRHTYNCRRETMKSKPAFRESWWAGRRCVIPVQVISEWCYESGRAQMWHIRRADDEPMALAGLWNEWVSPTGETLLSFSMLTLNADGHGVFGRMNAPDHEKRMPVLLLGDAPERWLYGSMKEAEALIQRCPAKALQAEPREPDKAARGPRPALAPDLFPFEGHEAAEQPPRRRTVRTPRPPAPKPPQAPGPTTGELF
jgi:putative SOS response-associated peptidase YedK